MGKDTILLRVLFHFDVLYLLVILCVKNVLLLVFLLIAFVVIVN